MLKEQEKNRVYLFNTNAGFEMMFECDKHLLFTSIKNILLTTKSKKKKDEEFRISFNTTYFRIKRPMQKISPLINIIDNNKG